jgi:hypothetical protein
VTEDDVKRTDAPDQEFDEDASASEPSPTATEPTPEAPPILTVRPADRQWRGGGGLSRWSTLGCGAGVIVLVALLAVGVSLTKKTAWMTFDRTERRIMAAVEQRNEPAERLRTRRNVDRFKTQLRISRDPYPLMGEFMKQVQSMLDDGSLDAGEVEEFNVFLESKLPSTATSP